MSDEKVLRWNAEKADAPDQVSLMSGVDLTVHPSSTRASFPGLPPLTLLTPEQLLEKFLVVPSTTVTGIASFGMGVLWAMNTARIRSASMLRRPWLAVTSLLLVVALQVFLRRRRPRLPSQVSRMDNVSSSPKGPCRVVCNAVLLTNSHAGTHADTPYHFATDRTPIYPDIHYTGAAVLIDLCEYLHSTTTTTAPSSTSNSTSSGVVITKRMLRQFENDHNVSLLACWRLLIRTTTVPYHSDDTWQGDRNAHFSIDAADYLAKSEKLMLIGLDAPSVDGSCVSPIGEACHGKFLQAGVAILENLSFDAIPFRGEMIVAGSMLTVFNPALSFEDSRGCMVTFFPDKVKKF